MAGCASGLVAEQVLAAPRRFLVEATLRWIRNPQAQLVVEQCAELRGDEIRRLRDEQAKTGIAETAVAAHLSHAHVAVPIRDRPVRGERFEADTLKSVAR